MVTMRSSILVNSFSPALRLPRPVRAGDGQAGFPSPPAAIRTRAAGSPPSCNSLKPGVTIVAERAPAAAASRITLHREARRHQHQHVIGLFPADWQNPCSRARPDGFALRIDRKQPAFVVVLDQIGPDALGIIAGLVGAPTRHDVARGRQSHECFSRCRWRQRRATICRPNRTHCWRGLP